MTVSRNWFDEDDSEQTAVKAALRTLTRLAHDRPVLIVHHTGHQFKRARGSSLFEQKMVLGYYIERVDRDGLDTITVTHRRRDKDRRGVIGPGGEVVHLVIENGRPKVTEVSNDDTKAGSREFLSALMVEDGQPVSPRKLRDTLGWNDEKIQGWIRWGLRNGMCEQYDNPKRKRRKRLSRLHRKALRWNPRLFVPVRTEHRESARRPGAVRYGTGVLRTTPRPYRTPPHPARSPNSPASGRVWYAGISI